MLINISNQRKNIKKYIKHALGEYIVYIYKNSLGYNVPFTYKRTNNEAILNHYLSEISIPLEGTPWVDMHYVKKILLLPSTSLTKIIGENEHQFLTYKNTLMLWLSILDAIKTHLDTIITDLKQLKSENHDFSKYKILNFNIRELINSTDLITINPSVFCEETPISKNQFTRILIVLDNMTRHLLLLLSKEYQPELDKLPQIILRLSQDSSIIC